MTASDLFHAGRLREAIDAQLAKVKAQPTDQSARFFLFELFLFAGDLDRARRQLDVLKYDDPKHSAAVEQYRFALDAEAKRRAVFAGKGQPEWLSQDGGHLSHRLEAVAALARGDQAAAVAALAAADALTPPVAGTIDGKPFVPLADADERFGPVLEVFGTGGVYSWVPFASIQSVMMNPPAAPRDILLRPAHLVLDNGVAGDVLLPALYPNTFDSADEELKLGRATDWVGEDGDVPRGLGGRQLRAGDQFLSLADVKVLTFGAAG
jgi:type VI secretion system protein ImpE